MGTPHKKNQMFAMQVGGGTPHIPIEGIWSDIQARVGTWDTAQNSKMFEKGVGRQDLLL